MRIGGGLASADRGDGSGGEGFCNRIGGGFEGGDGRGGADFAEDAGGVASGFFLGEVGDYGVFGGRSELNENTDDAYPEVEVLEVGGESFGTVGGGPGFQCEEGGRLVHAVVELLAKLFADGGLELGIGVTVHDEIDGALLLVELV